MLLFCVLNINLSCCPGTMPQVLYVFQQLNCYNLRLGSGCNLGKDLSKGIGMSQLVKCKDTGQYLLLYIPIDNENNTW